MPPRKKKVNIACINCSKCHVTCEDKRPCARCIRKGLQSSCIDAPRKRRKYLADVPEELLPLLLKSSESHDQQKLNNENYDDKCKFLSNAADLEYSILSNIIHQDTVINKISDDLSYNGGYSKNYINNSSLEKGYLHQEKEMNVDRYNQKQKDRLSNQDYQYKGIQSNRSISLNLGLNEDINPRTIYTNILGYESKSIVQSQVDLFTNYFPLKPYLNADELIASRKRKGSIQSIRVDKCINQYYLNSNSTLPEVLDDNDLNYDGVSYCMEIQSPDDRIVHHNPELRHSLRYSTPMEIYTLISEPFSYTSGFHSLLKYLRCRFKKEPLIEMCRSLAEFRPIFIASTINLTEEDMIFMEQSYQRTLLEYDHFISQTGTPTCVWRRNGQIAYVNDEFSLLTGWSRNELLYKMSFIVELMDDQTVQEYFRTFRRVAYTDFKGCEKMNTCRLLTPVKGRIISCCCIWTLKRDVFGLPLMIIGNFMPILNNHLLSKVCEGKI